MPPNQNQSLLSASRCHARQMPRSRHTSAQSAGLAYERKVISALADGLVLSGCGFDLSHNPWFEYNTAQGRGYCVPDAMLSMQSGEYVDTIFVIEVKLTYVPDAIEKLDSVYCPIVRKAFNSSAVVPIVICKNLVPQAPRAMPTFFGAVAYAETDEDKFALVQWLGNGKLPLGFPETVEHLVLANRA